MTVRSAIVATPASWGRDCAELCAAHEVSVRMVADGLDALTAALESLPDLFVCDAEIPGVDYLRLCQKVRQHEQLRHLEILLLIDGAGAEASAVCAVPDAHCATTVEELLDTLSCVLTEGGGARPAGTDAVPARPPEPAAPSLQEGRPKILIVDDDRDVLRGLKVRLRTYDVDVTTETGGRDALYTALRIKPDVIVTDYSMPQGSGEYFLLRLKEEPALREVPIIVMTGWTFDGSPDVAHERDMLGRCGASVYLRKPIEFPVLLAELERYVPMRTKVEASA
jgi:two-component system NtrC family sensor kinase